MKEKQRGERKKKALDSVEEVPLLTGLSEQTYLWKKDADEAENLPTGKLEKPIFCRIASSTVTDCEGSSLINEPAASSQHEPSCIHSKGID